MSFMINILMVFTVLILLMTGVLVIGGNYFYKLAIDTGTSKASVFKSKDNMENSKSAQKETVR
ncbi:alpha/beta hydrolase, partial [Clostridium butyricum]